MRGPLPLLTLALIAIVTAALPGSAQATTPGVRVFKAFPSDTQAGGHPDVNFDIEIETDQGGISGQIDCGGEPCIVPRRFGVHYPEGFIGNPHVALKCSLSEFSTAECPSDAQIGTFVLAIAGQEENYYLYGPLYNMETNPNQAGLVGAATPYTGNPIFFELFGRTDSDYGLDVQSTAQLRVGFSHYRTKIWGVPASDVHTVERFQSPLKGSGICAVEPEKPLGCQGVTYQKATIPEAPFLQNPTTCDVQTLSAKADGEYFGGQTVHAEYPWPPTTGCSQASFNPSLTAKPTTSQADTASGLDVQLSVPQTQSPTAPAPSELRTSRVTLPEGFSINPNAADGKLACPEELTAIGTLFAATCPEYSKIGTLMLDVAALPAPIPGAWYLADPKPGEPYRVLLAADGFATHVKLLGRVELDPETGQITTVLSQPQAPLQEFALHLFGSERGLLATPSHCGTFSVKSEFVPWNSKLSTRHTLSTITIDSGPGGSPCPIGPRPFNPRVQAGTANNSAGLHSPFTLTLDRDDGDQNLTGLTVKTPPGFAGTLKGVPYCSEAAIARISAPGYAGKDEEASPACPVASQIGTVVTGAGASSHPLYVSGKVYLAGPYKGAPLSLVAVVPAVSGPYDLGNVAVRAAIQVNPTTAQVTTVSDPLPQILEGIPLRTRSVIVNLDRPDFTFNPTNCEPLSTDSTILGSEGASSRLSAHFQASNCADLPYGPKLSLELTGGIRRRGHPAIHSVFKAGPGEAATRRISVLLPKGELLDNAHIGTVCTRVDFAKDACPAAAELGRVEAKTPLLDQPLKGKAYLRSSSHDLPDLALDLEGQIDIEAVARIDSVNARLRTTFESLPDAPLSEVVLDLKGGSRGLLINSETLCGKPKRASVRMVGHNGARLNTKVKLQVSCGSKARKKHRHHTKKAGH
jgi:hypothetical protein